MSKNSVEQTAYFWAMGAKNNLDLDKFRDQVEEELKVANSTDVKEKGDTIIHLTVHGNNIFY